MTPFLTFYTPTFRRPQALAACLASVAAQTAVKAIEQIVIADHVGIGIDGMYARVQHYAEAVHGRYVHVLADDDVLASPHVVDQVMTFAEAACNPAVILVGAVKNGCEIHGAWPPVCGGIDLGNLIVRADVWKTHARYYGRRYEGDYDFAAALAKNGYQAVSCPVTFLFGGVRRGAPEVAA